MLFDGRTRATAIMSRNGRNYAQCALLMTHAVCRAVNAQSTLAAAMVSSNRTAFALVFSEGMRAAFVYLYKWRHRAVERVGNGTE